MGWIAPPDGNTYLNNSQKLNNAQLVANHFIATGWTPNAISALCGNMSGESTLNPNLYEQGYGHSLSRGYGLVQWTPATKLMNWCSANSLDWSDGDAQLSRIDYEQLNKIQWISKTSYNYMSFNQFTTSTESVDYLTEAFIWSYERPSSYYGNLSLPKRKEFANTCFTTLDWSGSGTIVTPDMVYFAYPTGTQNVTSGFEPPDRPDHYGVDFADGNVYDIWASADGTVTRSEVSDSYGEVVYILHNINGQDYETVYAHMATGSRTVALGDTVTQGQKLGVMGSTGDSTGLHLHFELYKGRWTADHANAIDPMTMLGVPTTGDPADPNASTKSPQQIQNNKIVSMLMTDTLNGWKW
jgi:murein DD-endopeptidase MepM/ murein hydrolase activator NlpD